MTQVVAGKVVQVRPHPQADKVWLADVHDGQGERQVVWGGVPVLSEGDLVPLALPGARIPSGKIRRRRYRGEPSEGMLCSLAELGWGGVSDRVALLKGVTPGEPLILPVTSHQEGKS